MVTMSLLWVHCSNICILFLFTKVPPSSLLLPAEVLDEVNLLASYMDCLTSTLRGNHAFDLSFGPRLGDDLIIDVSKVLLRAIGDTMTQA